MCDKSFRNNSKYLSSFSQTHFWKKTVFCLFSDSVRCSLNIYIGLENWAYKFKAELFIPKPHDRITFSPFILRQIKQRAQGSVFDFFMFFTFYTFFSGFSSFFASFPYIFSGFWPKPSDNRRYDTTVTLSLHLFWARFSDFWNVRGVTEVKKWKNWWKWLKTTKIGLWVAFQLRKRVIWALGDAA